MTNTKCQTGLAPYAGRCSRQTPLANQLLQTKPYQNRAKKSATCIRIPLLHDLVKLADSGDPDVMFREGVSQLDNAGGKGGSESALSWSEVKSTCLGGAEDRAGTASGGPSHHQRAPNPPPTSGARGAVGLRTSTCSHVHRTIWRNPGVTEKPLRREFPKRSCLAASDVTGATLRIIRRI